VSQNQEREVGLRELVLAFEKGPTKPPKLEAEQEKGRGESHQVDSSSQREREVTLRDLVEAFVRGPVLKKTRASTTKSENSQDEKDGSYLTYNSSFKA
jgi:hypothetical protein